MDQFLGDPVIEDGLHQLVAEHAGRIEHFLASGLGLDGVLGRNLAPDQVSPISPSKRQAFMVTRSMTPSCSCSTPRGICIITALCLSFSRS